MANLIDNMQLIIDGEVEIDVTDNVEEMRYVPVLLEEYKTVACRKPNFVTTYNEFLKQIVENPYKSYPESTTMQAIEFLNKKIKEVMATLEVPSVDVKSVFTLKRIQIEDIQQYFLKNSVTNRTIAMEANKERIINSLEGIKKQMNNNNMQEVPAEEKKKPKRRGVAVMLIEVDDLNKRALFKALIEDDETGVLRKERQLVPFDVELAKQILEPFFEKLVGKNLIMFKGNLSYKQFYMKLKDVNEIVPKLTNIEGKILIPIETHFQNVEGETNDISFDEFVELQLDNVTMDSMKNYYGENHWKLGLMYDFIKVVKPDLFKK